MPALLIKEDDGLPHKVCVRCLGTLEFLCDFYDACHQAQKEFTAKRNETCNKTEDEFDTDSDKENTCPSAAIAGRETRNSQENTVSPINTMKIMTRPGIQADGPCKQFEPLARTIISNKTLEEVDRQELLSRSGKPSTMINDLTNISQVDGESDTNNFCLRRRNTRGFKIEKKQPREAVVAEHNTVKRKRGRPPKKVRPANPEPFQKQCLNLISANEISSHDRNSSTAATKNASIEENLSRKAESSLTKEEIKFKTKDKNASLGLEDNTKENQSEPLIKVKDEKSSDTEEALVPPPQDSRINPLVWIPGNIIIQESRQANRDISTNSSLLLGSEIESTQLKKSTTDLNNTDDRGRNSANMQSNGKKEGIERSQSALLGCFERDADVIIHQITEEERRIMLEKQRSRRIKGKERYRKISELITDEQKGVIETFYKVDMSVVNADKVQENLTVIDKKTVRCKICGLLYLRLDKCQVHVWSHLNMRPYQCNACEFSTVTVSNVRCHIRKSHLKIKPFACNLCEKKYVTAVLLEEHLNTHTGERPFKCKLCNFASSSRQVLSYHNTTHKTVKDIACKVCGKEFYSKGRMRAHMLIHNKDKVVMCKLCSSYLSNAKALEAHNKNVHMRDYICNVCGKKLKSRKALHNHQNVHAAAKYKCTLCPNVYKSSHILKEHLLKHEGIRKYKCTICEKSFAQQSHLAAHMAVHSEIRFHCPACQRAFNRHDNMKNHTKRCEAFLANPEMKDLLIKREKTNSTFQSDGSTITSKDNNTPTKDTSDIAKRSDIKTDVNIDKTDVNVRVSEGNANINVSGEIPNYVVLAVADDSNVIKVDEVRILEKIVDDPKLVDDCGVNVVVNVLAPDKF